MIPASSSTTTHWVPTCTCTQHRAASPLDGDCAPARRRHHALRFQTKQSIIIMFCWSTRGRIRAQPASLDRTSTTITVRGEKRRLNFKLTTQVHLFLVLSVSPPIRRLPGNKQTTRSLVYHIWGEHCLLRRAAKLKHVLIRLILRYNVLVLTQDQQWIKGWFGARTAAITMCKVNNRPGHCVWGKFDSAPRSPVLFCP